MISYISYQKILDYGLGVWLYGAYFFGVFL